MGSMFGKQRADQVVGFEDSHEGPILPPELMVGIEDSHEGPLLPPELIETVLRKTDRRYWFVFRRVCKLWREILGDPKFYTGDERARIFEHNRELGRLPCGRCSLNYLVEYTYGDRSDYYNVARRVKILRNCARLTQPLDEAAMRELTIADEVHGFYCVYARLPCPKCLIARCDGYPELLKWLGSILSSADKCHALNEYTREHSSGEVLALTRLWECDAGELFDTAVIYNRPGLCAAAIVAGAKPKPIYVRWYYRTAVDPDRAALADVLVNLDCTDLKLLLMAGASASGNLALCEAVYATKPNRVLARIASRAARGPAKTRAEIEARAQRWLDNINHHIENLRGRDKKVARLKLTYMFGCGPECPTVGMCTPSNWGSSSTGPGAIYADHPDMHTVLVEFPNALHAVECVLRNSELSLRALRQCQTHGN